MIEKYYKVSEVAEIFRVSNQSVKLWIKKGKIQSVKTPGGINLIPESEIEKRIKK